ncbi:hypothetical protein QBE52_16755 [Clostridiaceae bacterium 35-E11]
MFSKDQMDLLMKKIMSQLNIDEEEDPQCQSNKKQRSNNNNNNCKLDLSPSQILIILALISGALEVDSLLVDKNQEIQIVLVGTLKQKTQMEKIMDQVGTMPFDEVMRTLLGRY